MSGITPDEIAAYQRDGAVCVRGAVPGLGGRDRGRDRAQHARARALCRGKRAARGARAASSTTIATGSGSRNSGAWSWNRRLRKWPPRPCGSRTAQFFHDHVLVKEPGTQKATPWHQDIPYYFVDGAQTVSFWIPIDPVQEATLRLIAGSQRWDKWVLPVRWLDESSFYADADAYRPVPDPDHEPELQVLEWALEPGDAVLFDFRTVHGARGNAAAAAGARCRCAGSATMRATRNGRAAPRRLTRGTAWRRGSACARTGSRWCGRASRVRAPKGRFRRPVRKRSPSSLPPSAAPALALAGR